MTTLFPFSFSKTIFFNVRVNSRVVELFLIPILFTIQFFYFPIFSFSQESPSNGLEQLKLEIRNLQNDPDLKHGQLGFVLMEVETGKVLALNDPDKTLIPASTLKSVTSATALLLLGDAYVFKTYLEYEGIISDSGVLNGNIYIRGGGDPSLGSDRIENIASMKRILTQWVSAIRDVGIREIRGSVIGDGSKYGTAALPDSWQWADIGNYYGAGAHGLNINENSYTLFFSSGSKPGDPTKILRTEPEIPGLIFINEVKSGGTSDNAFIYGSPYTKERYLRGTIPAGRSEFAIKGSIPDPVWFTANALTSMLVKDGISITNEATTVRLLGFSEENGANKSGVAPKICPPEKRKILMTYKGPTLAEVVYWLNKKSINLYGEQLLKLIGAEKGRNGSTEEGIRVIEEFWKSKGLDLDGFRMADGSGLSRLNGVTARQMATLLRIVAKSPVAAAFVNSLPIAGDPADPGSLSSLCTGTKAAKNLCAKSGFISQVRSYAGYVNSKSGKQMCFAMIANNFTCTPGEMKKKLERLMVKLGEIE